MTLPSTAAGLVESLTAGVAAHHLVCLDVGGCRIDIHSNHRGLVARLERYFHEVVTTPGSSPDFRIVAIQSDPISLALPWAAKQPDAGKTRIKEEWVDFSDGRAVRKRLTGMAFVFGGDAHLAHGPCFENDNQIVNFVNNRYMQWRLAQGYLLAHAGAVARDGRCLALCGPPGAGKSTTALSLLSAGLDFVSNDRLLLKSTDGSVEVQGIPKHPRVNPGTILSNPLLSHMIEEPERSRLKALPGDELRRLEQKHDVMIHEVFGPGRFRMQAELEALVVFNWGGSGQPSIGPADLAARLELLPMITKSPGLFYEADPQGDALDLSDARYVATLSASRVLEVTGRQDFEAARRLCLEALDLGAAAVG